MIIAAATALALAGGGCDGGGGNPGVDGGGASDGGGADGSGAVPNSLVQARWQNLAPMPQPRYYIAVTATRGRVFAIGGFITPSDRAVHAFDPLTGAWTELAPLPKAFKMANAAAVGDRLFVLGGLSVPDTVEYDFAANAWTPRAPMPFAEGRGVATVGVYQTKILLAGGILPGLSANGLNTGVRKSELLTYDTATDTWEVTSEMPVENAYAMGAVLGTQFWHMGGSTNFARTDQVLVYDVLARTWSTRPPLPKSISSAATGVVDGRIVITGGIATSIGMISPDTLVLDPVSGEWSTLAPLPTPRFGMGGAVLGKQLFVPSGLGSGATPEAFLPLPQMEVLSPP